MRCSCIQGTACPREKALRQAWEMAEAVKGDYPDHPSLVAVILSQQELHKHRREVQTALWSEMINARECLQSARTEYGEVEARAELGRVQALYTKAAQLAKDVSPWAKFRTEDGRRPTPADTGAALDRLRSRYHALIAESLPHAWMRADCRQALHHVHPEFRMVSATEHREEGPAGPCTGG